MKGNLRLVSWVLALLENSCGSGRLSLGSLDLSACRSITRSKLLISEVVVGMLNRFWDGDNIPAGRQEWHSIETNYV
ncbi:hypothetical protein SCA6_011820 [Theobroma cacao]